MTHDSLGLSTGQNNPSTIVLFVYRKPAAPEYVQHRLEEAETLAQAGGLKVVHKVACLLRRPHPGTLLRQGWIDQISDLLKEHNGQCVLVDPSVNAIHQRNLEKIWGIPVLDRTRLILHIFSQRARSAEGTLQVELATQLYQKSRLVKAWSHLERQRGGFGFLGGPGESQLELDRRLIEERIRILEEKLRTVASTRALHRHHRQEYPHPLIALVGYTNAGKSTLFNQLTQADVWAANQPFATLDPTIRVMRLPSGRRVMLADTVGFISQLPTLVISAFRATLEEVVGADLLLHVHDTPHPLAQEQSNDVVKVLHQLDPQGFEGRVLDVWNKADALSSSQKELLLTSNSSLLISALTGEGLAPLLQAIEGFFERHAVPATVSLPFSEGAKMQWLYDHTTVRKKDTTQEALVLDVMVPQHIWPRFEHHYRSYLVENLNYHPDPASSSWA